MSGGALRPRLVAVWLVLLGLIGVIVAIEHADRARRGAGHETTRDPRLLLPVPVTALGAIEVAHAGRLHRFERDRTGAWFYHGVHTGAEGVHAHAGDPAMATRIERAFAAFGRTRIERQFALQPATGDYGVTTPETLILLYRPREPQPLVQYAVGDIAPDTVSRYVLVVGSSSVATIPNYQIDNLLALLQAVGGASDRERATGGSPARRGGSGPPGPRGLAGGGPALASSDAGRAGAPGGPAAAVPCGRGLGDAGPAGVHQALALSGGRGRA